MASIALLPQLKFEFDFEQFFPEGDEDLAFYKDFIQDFETDNNFLLVGVENESGVFEQSFLSKLQKSTTDLRDIPQVKNSQSITSIRLPFKTPFGFTSFPLVHVSEPDRYASDREKILNDKRFVGNLINDKGTAAVILLKTIDTLPVTESDLFIAKVDSTMRVNGLSDYHLLGRGFFQSEIVKIQKTEVLICGIISFLAVMIIMWLIYRKVSIIFITLTSVTVSLIVFFGFLSVTNRGLSLMSALYPVIILIAGTSDIIHILNKYLFELRHGKERITAISNTMKEVGLSTFITSATTAVGFLALMTSRLRPVREFGFNCAIGVMITFIIAVPLTMALLSYFDEHKISQDKRSTKFWDNFIQKLYLFTKNNTKSISWGTILITVFCFIGMSKISTNYSIQKNLPLNAKVGIDFLFFEKQFSGFRPLEFAVLPQGNYKAGDYEVVKAINDLESHLESYGVIGSIMSQASLYKSLVMSSNENNAEAYTFPEDEESYNVFLPLVKQILKSESAILVNADNTKTRISSRISDIGADSIKMISGKLDGWIDANIDSSVVKIKQTGTGLILDKNSQYVKENLINGLGLSLLLISLMMAFLVKSWRMAIVAFVPNFIPILFAASLLGWLGIDLEAGISIVFGVVFGIVVDDTIHFLGRYKILIEQKHSVEEALHITITETGRALIFTTIILFTAFLVMVFSSQPLTRTVGTLISVTFISALASDILLIPVLIRWLYPEHKKD